MLKKVFNREEQEAYNVKRANELYTDPERIEKYLEFARLAYDNDVVYFRIDRIAQEYVEDFFDFKGVSDEDKLWAYSLGYSGWRIHCFGLNKDNYRNYISDFEFYNKNNYMNERFVKWFDHKLSTYYILNPFIEHMPIHFFYITGEQVLPLNIDCEKANAESVIKLLSEKGSLAAKACIGGHGTGFYRLDYINNKWFANREELSKDEMKTLISGLEDYIITEYVRPNKDLRNACGEDAFSVLRLIMVHDYEDGPQLTGAVIRCGATSTGVVSGYPGSVNCGVDITNGQMFKPLFVGEHLKYTPINVHPDTNVDLSKVVIKNWDKLVDIVKNVSRHLAMTPYLVLDVIPADDGFKILEINSHGQVGIIEPYYPFLLNKYNRKVFNID